VVKPLKTEEELKANIFNLYSECRGELSSDRRQVYFWQLCEFVFRWCTDYLFRKKREMGTDHLILDANCMGLEICNVVLRLINKEDKTSIPEEEHGFFAYLKTALYKARDESHGNEEKESIHIPKGQRQEFKKITEFIRGKECELGRKISEYERVKETAEWFNIPEKEARKYLVMIDNKKVDSLTSFENEEKAIPDLKNDPESTFFSKFNAAIIREVVEEVLLNKQDRTRECYRALFTAYCIDKSIDFEGSVSVLNTGILEKNLKNGKKPEQYEVYKTYHPEVTKESAGVRASEMLKTLLNDIEIALKEKI